jgi:hypothetical protein
MARIRSLLRRSAAPVRRLVSICALVALCAIALSAATSALDGQRLRHAIATGFATGALVDAPYLGNDPRRGRYTVNDCLILQTLVLAERDWRNPGIRSRVFDGRDQPACAVLRSAVESSMPTPPGTYDYSRYFFAAKAFIGPALLVLDIDTVRAALRSAVYGVLLLVLAVSLSRVVRPRERQGMLPASLVVVSCAWLAFYDLRYYAPLFAHAFAELVLAGYMLFVLVARPPATHGIPARGIWLGALTACFELLTGPALLAAGIAVLLDFAQDPTRPRPLRRALLVWSGTALAILVTLLLLQVAVVAVEGPDALRQFVWHLLLRMDLHLLLNLPMEANWKIAENLASYTVADVGRAMFRNLPLLTYGSRAAANVVFVGSVLVLAWAAAVGAFRREMRPVFIYVGVAASLVAWSLVFSNHTVIHAWAMVRMAVLLPVCAALSLWSLYRPRAAGTPAAARPQN